MINALIGAAWFAFIAFGILSPFALAVLIAPVRPNKPTCTRSYKETHNHGRWQETEPLRSRRD